VNVKTGLFILNHCPTSEPLKRALRNLTDPIIFHALLAFLLLFQKLSLARNVAAVALGRDVLANALIVLRAMISDPMAPWMAILYIWRGISSLRRSQALSARARARSRWTIWESASTFSP
jgi:hypothetical protein